VTLREPVAIVGLALRLPDADSLEELAANLDAGRDSVRPVPADRLALAGEQPEGSRPPLASLTGIEHFDHEFFRISLREAQFMAPEQRIALQLACAAIEDAGYALRSWRGSRTGVVIAAGPSYYPDLVPEGDDDLLKLLGSGTPSLCGRIAYLLGLSGPAIVLDTGCSAGLVAVDYAAKLLQVGDCEQALVGGVSVHSTFLSNADRDRYAEVMATKGRSRAFDADADGTGDGEGGAMFVLKLLSAAERDGDDIRALVVGSAVNHNGERSNGLSAPSAAAQSDLITSAWERAGLTPAQASFIEAHGSGTRLGDMIEIDGLRRALGPAGAQPVPVASVKTNIGHLDRAAGLAGLAKVVAQLRYEKIYPSLHFSSPNPLIDFGNAPVRVVTSSMPWPATQPRYAGVSSFSMSGTNAHAVLAGAPPAAASPEPSVARGVATVSAGSWPALGRYCRAIADHLDRTRVGAAADLGDVLHVLNLGRDHLAFRVGVAVSSKAELVAGLRAAAARLADRARDPSAPLRRVVWACPDTESIDADAAQAAADSWPAFARAIAECEDKAPASLPAGDLDWFGRQYAAARLAASLGVPVTHAIGTGRGALVALVVNGECDLPEALRRLADGGRPDSAGPAVPVWLTFESLAVCGPALAAPCFDAPAGSAQVPWSAQVPLEAVAALYEVGVDIGWGEQHAGRRRRRIALPTYPFEPTSVWIREPRPADACEVAAISCTLEADVCSLDALPAGQEAVEQGLLDAEGYERVVRAAWSEILAADHLDLEDDYFDLGGTSAMALQMLTTVRRRFGIRMKLIDLYEARRLGEFAARVAALHDETMADRGESK
jgi:acyl transferase domain-containing protein